MANITKKTQPVTPTKKSNTLRPILYTGSDEQLYDALLDRGLFVPTFEGKFDRKRAIRALQKWEHDNPEVPERMCTVVFHYSRHPSASSRYAQATINGHKYIMPYETEVELPEYVLKEVIDRAEENARVPLAGNAITSVDRRTIKTKIYPYSLISCRLVSETQDQEIETPVFENLVKDEII